MRPPAAAYAAFAVAFTLGLACPAAAQQVYKWKDARGTTHYSEKPPASGRYTTQDAVKDPVLPAPATTAAASTSEPRCTSARNTLARLQAPGPGNKVGGTAQARLSEAERTSQIELARSTLKAYNCSETAPAG